jgi:hypothetical protein
MTSPHAGWRRYIAALAAVLCLGLAGCGDDDDEPQDSGLPSGGETTANDTTSPSPEPTPTPPPEPANIDNTSPAAAKAFARHVVDLINYTERTLNLNPLEAVFGPGCQVCKSGFDGIRELAREGARIKGGQWTITFMRVVPGRPLETPLIDIVLKAEPERIFHQGKTRPEVNPGFRTNYAWYLEFTTAEGWKLVDWQDGD